MDMFFIVFNRLMACMIESLDYRPQKNQMIFTSIKNLSVKKQLLKTEVPFILDYNWNKYSSELSDITFTLISS